LAYFVCFRGYLWCLGWYNIVFWVFLGVWCGRSVGVLRACGIFVLLRVWVLVVLVYLRYFDVCWMFLMCFRTALFAGFSVFEVS